MDGKYNIKFRITKYVIKKIMNLFVVLKDQSPIALLSHRTPKIVYHKSKLLFKQFCSLA